MSNGANHNCGAVEAVVSTSRSRAYAGDTAATTRRHVRHIYVHIPFCARICPYCAFYKDLLDRSQTSRFCGAVLCELGRLVGTPRCPESVRESLQCADPTVCPFTIYFGGGTPTALNIAQLEMLCR